MEWHSIIHLTSTYTKWLDFKGSFFGSFFFSTFLAIQHLEKIIQKVSPNFFITTCTSLHSRMIVVPWLGEQIANSLCNKPQIPTNLESK